MLISLLVLELWQFCFKGIDHTEIWKSEISPPETCVISEDWGKLGVPNLARMFLMKCYGMLQNARVTAFTVSELLKEKYIRRNQAPFMNKSVQKTLEPSS